MAEASTSEQCVEANNSPTSGPVVLYKLRITLEDEIKCRWRRVIVPANFSLVQLHVVIQLLFKWKSIHLHQYWSVPTPEEAKKRKALEFKPLFDTVVDYSSPGALDERYCKLSDVFNEDTKFLEYEYDMGASWLHIIEFEGIENADPNKNYPCCIKGSGCNREEDHYDENSDGELKPEFKVKRFNLSITDNRLKRHFDEKWPLRVDNTKIDKCHLCKFYTCREKKCNGNCCKVCLKRPKENAKRAKVSE